MRALDQLVPEVTGGAGPSPEVPMGQWPARLVVALEATEVDAIAWDDQVTTWVGAADPPSGLWDANPVTASTYVDAVCWLMALECSAGAPEPEGSYEAGWLTMTLDNSSGRWSQWDDEGRLTQWLIGRRLYVWAELDGEPWWLWAGYVTRWTQTPERTVEVEAFDAFTTLQHGIGTWTPGAVGERPPQRLEAIATLAGYSGPRRFDVGEVTLLAPPTTRTPLEEMQQTAQSDGGVLLVDSDGALLYRDRSWPIGRADQAHVPVLSDNECGAEAHVWDLRLMTADDFMVNEATLTNAAAVPVTVTAVDESSQVLHGVLGVPGDRGADLWTTTDEGQRLAQWIVDRRGQARPSVEGLQLYLHDPLQPQLWAIGVDMRLGDLVQIMHEQPATGGGVQLLAVLCVVQSIVHAITPSEWVTTIATSRSVGAAPYERWDQTVYVWDDVDPRAKWGA